MRVVLAAWVLGLSSLGLIPAARAEAEPTRFRVEATLQPAVSTSSDGRFRLRAQTVPRLGPVGDSARLHAKLGLEPIGLDTCRFPLRLFRDSFESVPP